MSLELYGEIWKGNSFRTSMGNTPAGLNKAMWFTGMRHNNGNNVNYKGL